MQILKDEAFECLTYTAACFDDSLEKLFVVNRVAKLFKMKVNDKVELQVLQTQALIDQKAESARHEPKLRQSIRVQQRETPMFVQKHTGTVLVTENS